MNDIIFFVLAGDEINRQKEGSPKRLIVDLVRTTNPSIKVRDYKSRTAGNIMYQKSQMGYKAFFIRELYEL
jgi:hypothetical protein